MSAKQQIINDNISESEFSESEYDEEIEMYAGEDLSYDSLPVDEEISDDEVDAKDILQSTTRHIKLAFGEQPEEDDMEEDPTFVLDAQLAPTI